MEGNDISKRTVLVLLILTLVVSVVGTWTILSQPTTVYRTIEVSGPEMGKVHVGIFPDNGPAEPVTSDASGKVGVDILK